MLKVINFHSNTHAFDVCEDDLSKSQFPMIAMAIEDDNDSNNGGAKERRLKRY